MNNPQKPSHQLTEIKVGVSFPLSKAGKFNQDYPPETALAVIREAALSHFQVADEGQARYVLNLRGQRQDDLTVHLVSLAGDAKALEFKLVKELTQG